MGKVIKALIIVLGFWVSIELFMQGPSRAFDGAFASFFNSAPNVPLDDRTTPQRVRDSVNRSRDEADARRERLLSE